jgi:deoxycytidylate deaminase
MSFKPTTTRLNKPEYGCYLALAARSRSEDPHTQVGVSLFDEDWRTVSTGFNGFGPGIIVKDEILEDRDKKSCLINHAEINAILYSSKQAYHICGVFSPCIHCAKTIAASKIKSVYFLKEYQKANNEQPDHKYKEIFDFYGISYCQLTEKSLDKILFWIEKDKQFIQEIKNGKSKS